jgi:glycosyltransferase involved in cell wall biosynthesis
MTIRVGLIGNLAGGALMMQRPLIRNGVNATLFLSRTELSASGSEDRGAVDEPGPTLIYGRPSATNPLLRVPVRLWHELDAMITLPSLLSQDIIQSFTGSLFGSSVWRATFSALKIRPYIACATGSDLREIAANDTSEIGCRMRRFFAGARVTLLLNLDMVEVADRLRLTNAHFFPFAVDSNWFSPRPEARNYGQQGDLLFFMPSHLDWGVSDRNTNRNSTKGNDRFLHAFARLIGVGVGAHLIVLDRGPDRHLARKLVSELGIAPHVTFMPQMAKAELVRHMRMADVVVDQFDIGAFGTTGLEAMACGKPLMIFINEASARRCYPELPPVVNVHDETEIFVEMQRLCDPDLRARIGEKARRWLVAQHDADLVACRLRKIYEEVLSL